MIGVSHILSWILINIPTCCSFKRSLSGPPSGQCRRGQLLKLLLDQRWVRNNFIWMKLRVKRLPVLVKLWQKVLLCILYQLN